MGGLAGWPAYRLKEYRWSGAATVICGMTSTARCLQFSLSSYTGWRRALTQLDETTEELLNSFNPEALQAMALMFRIQADLRALEGEQLTELAGFCADLAKFKGLN